MGASIDYRESFLEPRLLVGLGSLENKLLFTGIKGKFILRNAMQKRLPDKILKFRKIGLSAHCDYYITKSTAFKDELELFVKSNLFQIPYFDHINI